jgi:hypothetical protein
MSVDEAPDTFIDELERIRIRLKDDFKYDAGQGLFCTRRVTAGEVLMQIPSRLVISVQQAYKDPTHGPVFSHLTKEAGPGGTRTALVGYLALQFWSISQSDYEPYLHLLLQPPNHHVLRYSDDQLESLSDAQYDKALQLLRDTDTMAEILWHVLNEPGGSYSDWSSLVTTAHMALVSRAFDDHDCVKLIPLLDMVQHSSREETIQHSTKQDGTVVVTSQRDLLPGEELFTHYAPHLDPDEFLVLYGFVP